MKKTYETEARANLSQLLFGVRTLQPDDHVVERARFFGIGDSVSVGVLSSEGVKRVMDANSVDILAPSSPRPLPQDAAQD
jgi:hypothetical protein